MSPLAVSEKRCLPDGISHACRFSLCALKRIVPAELKARRVDSAGTWMRLTRVLLAALQMSIENSFGSLVVPKANTLPSSAVRSKAEEVPSTDVVCRRPGKVYSRLTPSCWAASALPDGLIRISPETAAKGITEDGSITMRNSLLLHWAITSFGSEKNCWSMTGAPWNSMSRRTLPSMSAIRTSLPISWRWRSACHPG